MKILVLGGDGYLGWPTAMYFSQKDHQVAIVDNCIKRSWEAEVGVHPLWQLPPLHRRVRLWNRETNKKMELFIGDIAENPRFVYNVFQTFKPEGVIHYAEQPSAPFSMYYRDRAVRTQINNVVGTLNVLFAMDRFAPESHLVKLGTMGEYGTPNIDIEEGWIEIEHNGRRDRLPFPKQAGSFYHLSKVHDSHNIDFMCRIGRCRSTDLHQGPVYGIETDETELHPEFLTSFHYDEVFGTVLNRFIVQAVAGIPLTVYGKGGQTRGFLNILDTIQCVELAVLNPPERGKYRVYNQFTEIFSVLELAQMIKEAAAELGLKVEVTNVSNPRVEKDEHYYNAKNTSLVSLGLKPHLLTPEVLKNMIKRVSLAKDLIEPEIIQPTINWRYNK